MPHEPKFDPNDPYWWHREPEYEFPEIKSGIPPPTYAEMVEGYAEDLRTNTARLPRAVVERYVTVKDDPEKLRQFLDLVLDMSYDGNLYSHLPKGEEAESKLPPPDDEKAKEIEEIRVRRYKETTSHLVALFELEQHAKALALLKAKGD